MTRLFKLAILLGLLCAVPAFAQTLPAATSVQQHPTHQDACTEISTANTTVNAQETLTIGPPPSGQSVYISQLDLQASNDATGSAESNASFTSTNLNGWIYVFSQAGTASTQGLDRNVTFPTGLKAAGPGVKVTIVSPAAVTHVSFNIQACYWFAP